MYPTVTGLLFIIFAARLMCFLDIYTRLCVIAVQRARR